MPFYKAVCRERHAKGGAWKNGKKSMMTFAMLKRDLPEANKFVNHQLFGSTFWLWGPIEEITREEAKEIWAENGTPATDAEIDQLEAELAKPLSDMESSTTPPAAAQPERIVLHNNFTIYEQRNGPAIMEHARPQDWGHPKRYVYREYYYEATVDGQLYGHHCYCWTDVKGLEEWQYPEFFSPCVAQLLMPGNSVQEAGRRYLGEDDFWNDKWGPRPPYYGELDEN